MWFNDSLPPPCGTSPHGKHQNHYFNLPVVRCGFSRLLRYLYTLRWFGHTRTNSVVSALFGWVIPWNQQHTRQNNSFAWLVRLIRAYFLLFPVSLCALTVVTELRQVRHCAICRLLHPFTLQVRAVTGSVRAVTGSVRELVRI